MGCYLATHTESDSIHAHLLLLQAWAVALFTGPNSVNNMQSTCSWGDLSYNQGASRVRDSSCVPRGQQLALQGTSEGLLLGNAHPYIYRYLDVKAGDASLRSMTMSRIRGAACEEMHM